MDLKTNTSSSHKTHSRTSTQTKLSAKNKNDMLLNVIAKKNPTPNRRKPSKPVVIKI